jgi:5-methylcytosine-specific restriction endonuclease McrA
VTSSAEAPASHTIADLKRLFALQEGHCYYCFRELFVPEGYYEVHKDHFEPISLGGTNDIDNIVLACPECNMLKKDSEGVQFRRMRKRNLPPETKRELERLQRRVASEA